MKINARNDIEGERVFIIKITPPRRCTTVPICMLNTIVIIGQNKIIIVHPS